MGSRLRPLVLLGWALLYSRHGGDWRVVEDYPSSLTCERIRDARVDSEVQGEIGGALAAQSADNPLRREAYQHAERRVRERYRCEWQR